MTRQHGVTILALSLPEDGEEEPMRYYRLSDKQGKGYDKLPKTIVEGIEIDRQEAFTSAITDTPIETGLVATDFSDSYTYDRPQSTGWRGGLERVTTNVHVYLVVCRSTRSETQHTEWAPVDEPLSFDNENTVLDDAVEHVQAHSSEIQEALSEHQAGDRDADPSTQQWVTPDEIRSSKSFKYDWTIEFESTSGEPWHSDASYTNQVSKSKAREATKRVDSFANAFGDWMYCHNHHCENNDDTRSIEAETVLGIISQSPQPLSKEIYERLQDLGMERVEIKSHYVPDGFVAYILVGPNAETGDIEAAGWYCSPECVDSVEWPSNDHIAVAAELGVHHPPDIRRGSGHIYVDSIKGVYRDTPPETQIKLRCRPDVYTGI